VTTGRAAFTALHLAEYFCRICLNQSSIFIILWLAEKWLESDPPACRYARRLSPFVRGTLNGTSAGRRLVPF
jgi:hypothetical protein